MTPSTPGLTVVDSATLPSSLVIDVPAGTSPEVRHFVERVGETLEELLAAVAHSPTARAAATPSGDSEPFVHPSRRGPVHPSSTRLDLDGRSVWQDGQEVHLTHLEFELLVYFVANPARAVNRTELLDHVWRQPVWPGGARTVDVHVRRLRRKLGSELRIATVRGFGYRFDGWDHDVS